MKKKRRLKKLPIMVLIGIISIIIGIIITVKYIEKINSNEYKLEEIGYTEDEIKVIVKLKDNEIKTILNKEYNNVIPKLLKEKYFLFNNLEQYIEYFNDNKKDDLSHIISIVNVKANYDHYDTDAVTNTDISKGKLLLVNKYTKLSNEYVPDELTSIPLTYAYADNQTTKEVLDAFKNMWSAAKKEDLKLIVNSSYRDYESQNSVWNNYENYNGEEYADSIAARAGFSEHQTGLAIDVTADSVNGQLTTEFGKTAEGIWLKDNAHRFGYIIRYLEGRESETGYQYEPWHIRYVGVEAATEIYQNNWILEQYLNK